MRACSGCDAFRARARRDRAPRRALCARKIRSCSRCRMPARPNGIARIRPGSSSSSCWRRTSRRLSRVRRALRLSVQFLLRRRRPAPRAAAARPDHAAERRRGHRLSRACRCRGRAADRDGAGRQTRRAVFAILEIGLHHEQQHQELLLTDILHAFAQNPTRPGLRSRLASRRARRRCARGFVELPAGIHTVGHDGDGFCFDNEAPRASRAAFSRRASRAISSPTREWLEFIADGGYATPSLWLSDGWATRARRKAGRRPAIGARSTAPGCR